MRIAIVLLFILTACEKPVKKPQNLISKDEMIDIISQSYLYRNLSTKHIKKGKLNIQENQAYILQNRGYNWEQFKQSYAYYMLDEKTSEEINKKVIEELNLLIPEKKEDSLNNKIKEAKEVINKDEEITPIEAVIPIKDDELKKEVKEKLIKNDTLEIKPSKNKKLPLLKIKDSLKE